MDNLITVADFRGVVPFSANIGAHLVDPHIADAQLLDLWPLLPEALRTDLETTPRPAKAEALFADHLKRLLVLESARRLLLWHGLHITPAGAESTTDRPISPQERAALRADLQGKAAHFRPTALAAVAAAYPATSSTSCGARPRRPGNGGFRSAAL